MALAIEDSETVAFDGLAHKAIGILHIHVLIVYQVPWLAVIHDFPAQTDRQNLSIKTGQEQEQRLVAHVYSQV